VSAPETAPLSDKLLAFANEATDRAATFVRANRSNSSLNSGMALDLMRAAREALEARRIADRPLTDDDSAATAEHVKALRAQAAAAREALDEALEQRDDLARFLGQLAAKFESVETDTAARVAARIRYVLALVGEALTDENVPRPEAERNGT
jgi:multidrug efflux pump subunit AcrA (membrane-fusion protein)